MWENIGQSADGYLITEAIRETEEEIFKDAFDAVSDENDYDDSLEQIEGWDGDVSNDELMRESLGEIPIGEAGLHATRGEEALMRENAYLRNAVQQLLPEPERPDMFADPEAWERNVLEQARGGGIPIDPGPSPFQKPDMFADPDGYERWMLAEIDRRAGVGQHHEDRINGSMRSAHELHGEEFEEAFRDMTSLNPNDRRSQEAIMSIVRSPDPGRALMEMHSAIRGANQAARSYGGVPFAPMLRSSTRSPNAGATARARGTRPVTQEERINDWIADSAWDD